MAIEFFMPMIPPTVTAQEHSVAVVKGKPVFYNPPELKDAEGKLLAYLNLHRPSKPFAGPLRLCVKWIFPSSDKKHRQHYKYTRPDTDNLQKLLKDCMTKLGFWKDDAQVACELCEKFWDDVTGIYIRLEEIEE